MWGVILKAILSILGPILALITPELKAMLSGFLLDFYQRALKTPNPWDDFLAGILLDMFGIPRPNPA